MNYIYDIALNFQKYFCEFYEWRREDKISNIRKIPLYRVTTNDINTLKNCSVVVDNAFLEMVKNDIGTKKVMCLVSDGNYGIGILFNNDGRVIKKSSMLYDEEDEICGYAMDLDITDINFINKKREFKRDELRFFRTRKKIILKYLNTIENDTMWKYLYYECFKIEEDNIEKIKKTLLEIANKGYDDTNKRLYNSIANLLKIVN